MVNIVRVLLGFDQDDAKENVKKKKKKSKKAKKEKPKPSPKADRVKSIRESIKAKKEANQGDQDEG